MAESTSNYYELSCVNFTGKQAINPNVNPTSYDYFASHARVAFTKTDTTNNQYVMSSKTQNKNNWWTWEYSTNGQVYGNIWDNTIKGSFTPTLNTIYELQINREPSGCGLFKDGNNVFGMAGIGKSSWDNRLMYGSNPEGNGMFLNGKIYFAQIWAGASSFTLVRRLIPAMRISDSVCGLYDTVNNAFYTSTTSTALGNGGYVSSLTLTLTTQTGGTVSGGGSIHKRLDGTYKYTAKATANSGYRFAGWYSDSGRTKLVSSNATYNGTMTAATTLYAKFLKTYTLTLTANPAAGGTLSGSGTYDSGANVTAKATPATNYKFMGWYSGTTLKSSSDSYTFSLTADTSLVAAFNKLVRFKVNGTWKTGIMYIKVNGAWKRADTYIKVNGTWKK